MQFFKCYFFTLGGFDSDVERERTIDYVSKTYVNPIREATVGGAKPQPEVSAKGPRRGASRNVTLTPKVTTRPEEETVEVKVRERERERIICYHFKSMNFNCLIYVQCN